MKITRKNYAAVMGRINKFFQKDTKRFKGRQLVNEDFLMSKEERLKEIMEVGWQNYYPSLKMVWHDFYDPYIKGKCEIHPLQERLKDGKEHPLPTPAYIEKRSECILAITDMYRDTVIPIYIGNDVIITGEKMIIRDNHILEYIMDFNDSRKLIPYAIKNKTEEYVFYHKTITPEDRSNAIKGCIYNLLHGLDVAWDFDGAENFPENIRWEARSVHNELWSAVGRSVESIDYNNIVGGINKQLEPLKGEERESLNRIQLIIDLPEIELNGFNSEKLNDCVYFLFNGVPTYDMIDLVDRILTEEGYNTDPEPIDDGIDYDDWDSYPIDTNYYKE